MEKRSQIMGRSFSGHFPPQGWVPAASVYRKKTHTDHYLGFTFHHPLAHKVAVARNLMALAKKICTYMPDRHKEKQHIAEALNNNEYPSHHVNENW